MQWRISDPYFGFNQTNNEPYYLKVSIIPDLLYFSSPIVNFKIKYCTDDSTFSYQNVTHTIMFVKGSTFAAHIGTCLLIVGPINYKIVVEVVVHQ